MTENISIDSALKKAQNMITIPTMVAMFGIIILSYILGNNDVIPKSFIPVGFLLGIILGWIVWSYQVPKWKIWAYKRVKDINDLKRQAVESKIIWKDSSLFTKTEIWPQSRKEELNKIMTDRINKY